MPTIQKVVGGVVLIAVIATLTLPGRQTPAVLNSFRQLTEGTLSTAMGTSSGVK